MKKYSDQYVEVVGVTDFEADRDEITVCFYYDKEFKYYSVFASDLMSPRRNNEMDPQTMSVVTRCLEEARAVYRNFCDEMVIDGWKIARSY
jgi:hypothetical protein